LIIDDCEIDGTLARRFASALAKSTQESERSIHTLQFPDVRLDQEGLLAIAALLTHRELTLLRLELNLRGMDPAACNLI
jgi:hypothetical protein